MSLYHSVYISIADQSILNEATLMKLLSESRERNLKTGITGMLLVSNHHIIQAIEGEESVVKGLVTRLAADSRHRQMRVVMEGRISQRNFDDWSMGFQRVEQSVAENIPGFTDILERHNAGDEMLEKCNHSLITLIKTFCHEFSCEPLTGMA